MTSGLEVLDTVATDGTLADVPCAGLPSGRDGPREMQPPFAPLSTRPGTFLSQLDRRMTGRQYARMVAGSRRVTANLPVDLLEEAMEVSGKGITETLTDGLRLVKRARAYEKALRLKGRVRLEVDLEKSRERRRR